MLSLKSIPKSLKKFQFSSQRTLQQTINPQIDYYKILHVSTSATIKEIKLKYYELAKKYHPDITKGSDLQFKEILEASTVLTNQSYKSKYDILRVRNTNLNNKKNPSCIWK